MRKGTVVITLFVLILSLSIAMPAMAVSGAAVTAHSVISNMSICDGFSITYEDVHFDRDNTGFDEEAYRLTITDGAGTVLVELEDTREVDDIITSQTEEIPFSVMPSYNPIHLVLVSLAGNGFEVQVVWDLTANCDALQVSTGTGPSIPEGFVLMNVICDTPVYDTPAGSPVGSAAVTTGQTFFVNPEPVEGADGANWTEIFVSSDPNPFIPSICVN